MDTRHQATDGTSYWDRVYGAKADDQVSWYEGRPGMSLGLVHEAIAAGARSVIDIGGGTSHLVDTLVDDGLERLAVLDISETALDRARHRLGSRGEGVEWIAGDVTAIEEVGRFDVWHDRALFHFLTLPDQRERYRALLERTLSENGRAIVATFGPHGPDRCSGLEVDRYDANALGRQLGSTFTLQECHTVDHLTPRGIHQEFIYAVFAR